MSTSTSSVEPFASESCDLPLGGATAALALALALHQTRGAAPPAATNVAATQNSHGITRFSPAT